MINSKNTKRALISSVLALVVSITMLIGSTYAWFTDTATTGVGSMTSGNLDIVLEYYNGTAWVDAEGEVLSFKKAANATENEPVIWEPGCTYELPAIRVRNNGNLAIKYEIVINGVNGSSKLLEAIEFTANGQPLSTFSGYLNVNGSTSNEIVIKGHMIEEAGNEYKGLTVEGISITVYATQTSYESDSNDNKYDEDAVFPVSNVAELAEALENGGIIALANDISVTEKMDVVGDVVINMNGYTINGADMNGTDNAKDRIFYMTEGSSLTINAEDSDVTVGAHGLVVVPSDVKNATITLNGGNYSGPTQNGCLIRLRGGNENVNITLNNVTYSDTATDGYIISTQGFESTGNGTLTVNGGSYSANYGFQIFNLDATLTGVEIVTRGSAIEASGNKSDKFANVTVDNCNITVTPGVQVVNAPAAGIAASNGGTLTIKNSTITGTMKAVYYVYSSGGTIYAENNNIEGATAQAATCKNDAKELGTIVVDGVTQ